MIDEELLKKNIAHNLRHVMRERNVKGKELADKIGVSQNTLSYFLNGKRVPSLEKLASLAEVLDCSIDVLTGLNTESISEIVKGIDVWDEHIKRPKIFQGIIKEYSLDKSHSFDGEAKTNDIYSFDANIKGLDKKDLYAIRLSEPNKVLDAPANSLVLIRRVDKEDIDFFFNPYVLIREEVSYQNEKTQYWKANVFITRLNPCNSATVEFDLNKGMSSQYFEYKSESTGAYIRLNYKYLRPKVIGIVKKVIMEF